MSEFTLTDNPYRGPTKCYLCGDHAGPFIDTYTEVLGHGNVYICAPNDNRPGCLGQMAHLAGFLNPFDRKIMEQERETLLNEIEDLNTEVEAMRQLKEIVVFLRDKETRKVMG